MSNNDLLQKRAFIVKAGCIRQTAKKDKELIKEMEYLRKYSKRDENGNIIFSEEIKIVDKTSDKI